MVMFVFICFIARTCPPSVHFSSHTLPKPPPPTFLWRCQRSDLETIRRREVGSGSWYVCMNSLEAVAGEEMRLKFPEVESRTKSGSRAIAIV